MTTKLIDIRDQEQVIESRAYYLKIKPGFPQYLEGFTVSELRSVQSAEEKLYLRNFRLPASKTRHWVEEFGGTEKERKYPRGRINRGSGGEMNHSKSLILIKLDKVPF